MAKRKGDFIGYAITVSGALFLGLTFHIAGEPTWLHGKTERTLGAGASGIVGTALLVSGWRVLSRKDEAEQAPVPALAEAEEKT